MAATAVVAAFTPGAAHAQSTWVGDTSQDWNTAANWSSDPANPTGNFIINTNTVGVYPILGANSAFTPVDVLIGTGAATSGRLDHTAGSLSLSNVTANGVWFMVGRAGGTGVYNLADTSVGSSIDDFGLGSGSLTVGKLHIGGAYFAADGTGTVNVNTTGVINANSTQSFTDGASGQNASVVVGRGAAGTGVLNLKNGTINSAGAVWVGSLGAGTVNQTGGIVNVAGQLLLARNNNNTQSGTGTWNITGPAVLNVEGDVIGGFAGNSSSKGVLNINSGAEVNVASTTERWFIVNQWDSTQAEVNINGGTLNLNTNTDMRFSVGNGVGASTVNLNSGAINSYSGNKTGSNSTGELNLMQANVAGNNTFNLNGGTLTIQQIVTTQNSGTAVFNFNGGTLKASNSSANFIDLGGANQRVNVRNGGAIIDTNGFNSTVPQALLHSNIGGDAAIDGGLTKNGAGILTLSAAANDYTGPTNINNGGLVLRGNLSGTSGLTMASGTSLGIETANRSVAGTISLNSSTLNFQYNTGAIHQLNVTGAASIAGTSTINLNIVAGALTTGNYTLMTAASGLGATGFALGTLPPGFNQYSLSPSTATSLVLNVVANPTPNVPTYWTGLGSSNTADALNNWGAGSGIGTSNWSTSADGLTDPQQVPGAVTDVVFTAANASGAPTLTTTLDASYSIRSLNFDVPASTGITSAVINTNNQTLTIGSTGMSVSALSNASATISGTGQVRLNGSQTWAINSNTKGLTVNSAISSLAGATLTIGGTGSAPVNIGGAISDGGGTTHLVINSSGMTTLTGANSYTGHTFVKNGTLVVDSGGVIAAAPTWSSVGENGTDTGNMIIKGTGIVNVSNDFSVGDNIDSQGTLTIQDSAALNVSGVGVLYVGSAFDSGSTAKGIVNQTGGAVTITNTGNPTLMVGGRRNVSTGGSGTYNLSGGSLTNAGLTSVGHYGTGVFNQTGGTANFNNWLVLGRFGTGVGTYNISAGSLNQAYGSDANVGILLGQDGQAFMNVSGTGHVTTTNGIRLGLFGAATGGGTVNLNGGTITTNRVDKGGGSGTFFFNGGVLQANASNATFMQGLTGAYVKAGGAIIDSQANSITIAQPLLHDSSVATDGGLIKRGNGTLTLTGANTYNGPTDVQAGTLAVNKTTGLTSANTAINVASGAALVLNSTSATGSLSASSMTLNSSTLSFNLGGGGYTTGVPFYDLSGDLNRAGTNLINVSGAASSGTITLIQYAGNETGGGAFSLGTLPNRTSGTIWDLGTGLVELEIDVNPLKWSGLGDGSWVNAVQTTKNWVDGVNPADYVEGDPVLFDDTATGLTTVNIPANVTPGGVTVNNSSLTYTFTGAGGITGGSALVKSGTGTLVISNAGNPYTGGTMIGGGTVEIAGTANVTVTHFLGTGPIVNNGDILVNRDAVNQFDATFLVPAISGTGDLIIQENAAIQGANTFDGTVTVKSGATAFTDNAGALGSAVGGTIVESGGRLAHYGGSRDYGLEQVTISGTGPSYADLAASNGAIFVTGGTTATFGGALNLGDNSSVNVAGNLVWNGNIDGASFDMTKNGGGTFMIGGDASNIDWVVNAGVLQVGVGTAGGTSGSLGAGSVGIGGGSLVFNRSDTVTVSNHITDGVLGGGVYNRGGGTVTLDSATSDFFGNIGTTPDSVAGGVMIMTGSTNATTITIGGSGALRLTTLNSIPFVSAVNIDSNNAQTGRLELSNNLTDLFSGVNINMAGRNNLTPGIHSVSGDNSVAGNIVMNVGGGSYPFSADAGASLEMKGTISSGQAGDRTVVVTGAGVGTISGAISNGSAGTMSVNKVGTGTWTLNAGNSYNGNTTSTAGTLVLVGAAKNPVIDSGRFGITNGGALALDYNDTGDTGTWGAEILSDLATNEATGFLAGKVRTTLAQNNTRAIGWKDDTTANVFTTRYTHKGDINLDGAVDSTDFNAFVTGYGKTSGGIWADGNFDYNDGGKVNTLDFNYLAGNFGAAPIAGPELASLPSAALGAVVPEPASLGVMLLGAAGLLGRRRRWN